MFVMKPESSRVAVEELGCTVIGLQLERLGSVIKYTLPVIIFKIKAVLHKSDTNEQPLTEGNGYQLIYCATVAIAGGSIFYICIPLYSLSF